MLSYMHSKERMKRWKYCFVPFLLSSQMKKDEEVWTLIQKLQQDPITSDTFSWKNYSLWYKYCLYLYKNSQLKQKIILELHTSPLGGHSRFLKTYHKVKKDFFWDGIKFDIQKFVAECLV